MYYISDWSKSNRRINYANQICRPWCKKALDQMNQRGTYYISRLKLNTNVYVKNPNPEYFKNGAIKKQSEYIQIDVKQILKQLQHGEPFE